MSTSIMVHCQKGTASINLAKLDSVPVCMTVNVSRPYGTTADGTFLDGGADTISFLFDEEQFEKFVEELYGRHLTRKAKMAQVIEDYMWEGER